MWRGNLGRPVHISWFIAVVCLGYIAGVRMALYATWLGMPVILMALGLILSAFWFRRGWMLVLCLVGGMGIGWQHGSFERQHLTLYEEVIGREIVLTGKVREDPTHKDRHQLVLQLTNVYVGTASLPGAVWVSTIGSAEIKRGDEVTVEGKLSEGFGTFAAGMYTARVTMIERNDLADPGRVVRDWFANAVRTVIAEPQASLGIGYLTGQKSTLPPDLGEALQIAGLSHIVVASGYNLTILVRLSRRLLMRVSKYAAAYGSTLLICAFMSITGLSPSMTRAGLVSLLSLATWYYGRKFHPFILLPFAAALTVLWQPSYIWGDLGWELSFTAFAGVMIVAPLLQRFFFGESEPSTLRQILGETVAAHVVTLPLIVASFGVHSNVAIIANLLIVPLVPLAMLLTFVSGVTTLIIGQLAVVVALPTQWLLQYMTVTASFLAEQPWAQTEIGAPWWVFLAYYIVLATVCGFMWRSVRFDARVHNVVV